MPWARTYDRSRTVNHAATESRVVSGRQLGDPEGMNHWWVNQNQTYVHEVPGGYMWSPKTNSNGARNRFYDAMTETQPGDVVFSFADT